MSEELIRGAAACDVDLSGVENEWNAENQLKRVTKEGVEVARFAYDPLGRRVEKVAGGVTYKF